MKKLFLLLLIPLLFAGCNKEDILTFDIDYQYQFVIPESSLLGSLLNVAPTEMSTNSQFEFANNNTNAEHIKDIKLKTLTLTITDPPGEDFSFLNEIYLYISADNLPKIEIASRTNIPDNIGPTIVLNTTDISLDDYLKKDKITVEVDYKTDEAIPDNVTVVADMVFEVTAELL